jgi:hypothetical protein
MMFSFHGGWSTSMGVNDRSGEEQYLVEESGRGLFFV